MQRGKGTYVRWLWARASGLWGAKKRSIGAVVGKGREGWLWLSVG